MALLQLAIFHLLRLTYQFEGDLLSRGATLVTEGSAPARRAASAVDAASVVAQAPPNVEPPWRNDRALVRRDSLNIRWTIPHSEPPVLYVELEHDGGFGGNFTTTLAIRSEYTRYQLNGLEPGSTIRFRLRAFNEVGSSSWSPEASFMALAVPSAPENLHAKFHPMAIRPEICWTPPSDVGGGGQDTVMIMNYRVWMHLSDGQVKLLAEVPGDRSCFEVDLPQIFSNEFRFSVNAVNQVYEGQRSNILELSRAGPPGQPGQIEVDNVTGSSIFLSWSPPSTRTVECNEALSVCGDIQAQFAHAPAATGYELYWDEGKGSLPSILVYAGAAPVAEISVTSSRGCYQFRVRATNSAGESYFTDIQSVSNLPLASPTGLKVESIRWGAVTLSWDEIPPSACVWWYELQMLNVAYGNISVVKSGLPQIDVEDLNSLHLYQFSVRLCDAASCSSFSNVVTVVPTREPFGPTAPYALHYENGLVTVTWSAWSAWSAFGQPETLEPFIGSFQVFAASFEQGPYSWVGSVSANVEPIFVFPCNETNSTNDLWPSAIFVKVVATVSSTWSSESTSAESEAARIFCAPLPIAPPVPTTSLLRTGTQREVPSLFDLTVELSLTGQPAEIAAVHTGWKVELVTKTDNTLLESVHLTDPGVQSYTFTDLPPAIDVTVRYAVVAFSGTGPLSPLKLLRVNSVPPQPVLQVDSSDDESVGVSWTWEPGIDDDELLNYNLYVDWQDGHFSNTNLQQPTYSTRSPNYLVNCTDGTLGGMSRSRQRLWFRVAAVSPAGIGELSESLFWVCGSVPDQPIAPTLEEVDSSFAMLGWTQPDLHGAALQSVKVVASTALGPNFFGFANSEYLYTSPGSLLNVTANLSQPLQFAIQVTSDVGQSPLSPWLSFSKLALPPLPPRLSIQSSTDSQIIVEWSLDGTKERGAYHTGFYFYVSVDGTTWPDEDTGYVATWQDEFTTTYTMDCTLTALLGGQSRSQQFLWFKVAARSAVGRGPLSIAVARRCSAPPTAPVNLALDSSVFDADGIGYTLLTWEEPTQLSGAVLLGYKVYVDTNTADTQDLYTLLDVIEDPEQRAFRHENVVQGQSYKYKVTAVSETGEGTSNEVILVPALVPLEPAQPVLLDDCTTSWYTSKALCTYPHNYELATVSVDIRESADINAPRVNPFVTVLQGTILEVTQEELGTDGRLYLNIPTLGGWLWDDTPLDPSNPLSNRLPALKFSWTWQDDEVRALGGMPLTAWYVYRSSDGVVWDTYTSLASTARDTSFECAVAEVGLPFWVRVSAVNSIGEGPKSEPLKLRCSLPPGMQPAPTQLEGDLNSIIVGFNPQNLHGAELLYHRLTYAFVDDIEGILNPIQLDVPGSETFVNITNLLPFSTYVFKVQAMTESGMSLDPYWQSNMTTGSAILLDPPSYLSSDGSTLRFTLANLTGVRDWPDDEVPSYNLYITADDREWLTEPTFVTSSLVFDHDCTQTPDHTQLDGNGDAIIVDQSYNFVYVKVSLSTATGPGFLSNASTFFCSPPPSQPVLEVYSSDPDQITLKWPNPDLFNAPLVGYNVFLDDGLGGDINLNKYVAADDVAYDETNASVMMSISPVITGRWYRAMVTVLSEAGESSSTQIVNAQTCEAPPNPVIARLSSSTSLVLQWNVSAGSEVCSPQSYAVISEIINYTGEVNQSLVLLTSDTIAPNQLEHQLDNLVSEAEYRFRVRSFVPGGARESGWTLGFAAGLPAKMDPVRHVLNASFATSIYLEWTVPDMNVGSPVGFQLFRNDGPGTGMQSQAEDCIAADCTQDPSCSLQPISRIPDATGCFIPGLTEDTVYRFWIRAVNEYGAGPLSEVAEISVGALPLVTAPTLVSALYENCTMTWEWSPAIERGKLVHSYDLKVERMNTSAELLIPFDGNSSAPYRVSVATVSSDTWTEAVPGETYRAAVRARSDVATSEWSAWSASSFCISEPQVPNPPRRDSVEVKAGRVQLIWDVVTSEMAGNDDLDALGVEYDIWGKPYPLSLETQWRRLYQLPAYEAGAQALSPSVAMDTFPETPVTATWGFKLRIANRNGYGNFSQELHLSTGQLASAPLQLAASVAGNGQIVLTWLAPISDGYIPLTGYQARCGSGPWEDVANTKFTHEMLFSPPAGLVTCEVRALNAVGEGAVAQTTLTLL